MVFYWIWLHLRYTGILFATKDINLKLEKKSGNIKVAILRCYDTLDHVFCKNSGINTIKLKKIPLILQEKLFLKNTINLKKNTIKF